MIPKKLKKYFDSMSKINDTFILAKEDIMPTCFILNSNGKREVLGMRFRDGKEKEEIRNTLLKQISQRKVIGYFLFQDSLMTEINHKTGHSEVCEVMMRTMFTPKEKYVEIIFYKDGNITERKILSKEDVKGFSCNWNIWETVRVAKEKELNEEYKKIKRESPDKYRSVS
jgi:hypothetical protein